MSDAIAFIGLGNMGGPMSSNLVKAGLKVSGFDLSQESRSVAIANGVTVKETLAECVNNVGTVVTMLPSGEHVVAVWSELMSLVGSDTLLIDCSTIDVDSARKVHALAFERSCASLDAPVSGGISGAASATLTFMVGGSEVAFSRGQIILSMMGKKIVRCGDAGAGQAAKICNNMVLGVSMAAVSEAFVLGERLGLSHQALFDVMSTSSGQCWSVSSYCPVPGPVTTSPANFDYKPGFATALMLKDLKLAQQAARFSGTCAPLGAQAAHLFDHFSKDGHAAEDFSAIIKFFREQSSKVTPL